MPTYAYRWADGTVSVCSASNKNEAALLFDRIAGISRKLVIRLKSNILVTLKPDIRRLWKLDAEYPVDTNLDLELLTKCYPHYNEVLKDCLDEMSDHRRKESRPLTAALKMALRKDKAEARERIERTPETTDLVILYPKGLPGQEN